MKKILLTLTLALAGVLLAALLIGCGGEGDGATSGSTSANAGAAALGDGVETDTIVGTWERTGGFSDTEWRTFDADGMIEDNFGNTIHYSVEEVESDILRLSTTSELSDEMVEWQQELISDYLEIVFDFSDFDVAEANISSSLAFHKERHESRSQALGDDGRAEVGDETWVSVRRLLAHGDKLRDDVALIFLANDLDATISDLVEQGATAGEARIHIININLDGEMEVPKDPQTVSFEIVPYTEGSFTDWISTRNYIRIEGNNLREFPSLNLAKDNQDEDLLWSATRR